MNTLQNVYDRLSDKTELAKHEVNLASLDEYNRLVFGDQTWVDELTKTISYIDRYVDGGLFVVKEGLKSITKTLEYEKKIPIAYRIRTAMQYGNSMEEYVTILLNGNSGDYANSWLFGDIHKNEIMRLELGLKYAPAMLNVLQLKTI